MKNIDWINYLCQEVCGEVTNATKINGQNDSLLAFLFAVIKHLIGSPTSLQERSSEVLMNLTCSKLRDFGWYIDIFLTKVMKGKIAFEHFGKKNLFFELPKLFLKELKLQ